MEGLGRRTTSSKRQTVDHATLRLDLDRILSASPGQGAAGGKRFASFLEANLASVSASPAAHITFDSDGTAKGPIDEPPSHMDDIASPVNRGEAEGPLSGGNVEGGHASARSVRTDFRAAVRTIKTGGGQTPSRRSSRQSSRQSSRVFPGQLDSGGAHISINSALVEAAAEKQHMGSQDDSHLMPPGAHGASISARPHSSRRRATLTGSLRSSITMPSHTYSRQHGGASEAEPRSPCHWFITNYPPAPIEKGDPLPSPRHRVLMEAVERKSPRSAKRHIYMMGLLRDAQPGEAPNAKTTNETPAEKGAKGGEALRSQSPGGRPSKEKDRGGVRRGSSSSGGRGGEREKESSSSSSGNKKKNEGGRSADGQTGNADGVGGSHRESADASGHSHGASFQSGAFSSLAGFFHSTFSFGGKEGEGARAGAALANAAVAAEPTAAVGVETAAVSAEGVEVSGSGQEVVETGGAGGAAIDPSGTSPVSALFRKTASSEGVDLGITAASPAVEVILEVDEEDGTEGGKGNGEGGRSEEGEEGGFSVEKGRRRFASQRGGERS
uniref:Uncharacterized protein n=1 Tax=Chromera velia CCMP2878 TaxID=1169474 RepID=A0A0G4FSF1_9ALVE|eukprot:Cvel_3693.t1-p1 / transcript=Cvel_3693.t1 / gene=Cvel_3693 / organism=Chromera_velia_CCMP2878 / gene_product=hypothetical protein / transcript_product=hypothetical protein / location=Cvel_scaffold153:98704-101136(-) / protein_length=554 / sequence_SO=supercontig / SO=protein_coding / is_pseudo=false